MDRTMNFQLEPGEPAAPALSPATLAPDPAADPVPPAAAALAKSKAAARAKRQLAYSSPEELVLAKTEQSMAPYLRAVQTAKARVDRFGFLGRLRDPEGYAQAQERLDQVRSAHEKAQGVVEQSQAEMLEAARRMFATRTEAPQAGPAGAVIELDPRRRPVRELGW